MDLGEPWSVTLRTSTKHSGIYSGILPLGFGVEKNLVPLMSTFVTWQGSLQLSKSGSDHG